VRRLYHLVVQNSQKLIAFEMFLDRSSLYDVY